MVFMSRSTQPKRNHRFSGFQSSRLILEKSPSQIFIGISYVLLEFENLNFLVLYHDHWPLDFQNDCAKTQLFNQKSSPCHGNPSTEFENIGFHHSKPMGQSKNTENHWKQVLYHDNWPKDFQKHCAKAMLFHQNSSPCLGNHTTEFEIIGFPASKPRGESKNIENQWKHMLCHDNLPWAVQK